MPEPVVLLTGFEPFGGDDANPSQDVVRALDRGVVNGHRIEGVLLPVAFAPVPSLLEALLAHHQPALVLALGQAGGRSGLSIERVALNLADARIADNAGAQPMDQPVLAGAPAAYFSSLPVKAMAARLRAQGIPADLSLSAGTYVCNQVFFTLAHLLATRHAGARGGFIHVPWLPAQAARQPCGGPSMALATMVEGVRAALECALQLELDERLVGGAVC